MAQLALLVAQLLQLAPSAKLLSRAVLLPVRTVARRASRITVAEGPFGLAVGPAADSGHAGSARSSTSVPMHWTVALIRPWCGTLERCANCPARSDSLIDRILGAVRDTPGRSVAQTR
jgi:hypothetical protein